MLKKLIKGFLFVFTLSIGTLIYFYIFPVYPDYNIPDEYFHTRFFDRSFDSKENGYQEWIQLQNHLADNQKFLARILNFYICIDEKKGNCHRDITTECKENGQCNIKGQEKEYVNKYFAKDFEVSLDKNRLEKIIMTYIDEIQILSSYAFIVTDKDNLFPEPVQYSNLMQLNKIIPYFGVQSKKTEQWKFQVFSKNYASLVKILNSMDLQPIEPLVVLAILTNQLSHLEIGYKDIPSEYRSLYRKVLEENVIEPGFMKNAVKKEYWHVHQMMLQEIFNPQKLGFSPKELFFYSEPDTLNLLKYQFKSVLEGEIPVEIVRNGRNFIGRTLIQNGVSSYKSHIEKEKTLIGKVESLKLLLSK